MEPACMSCEFYLEKPDYPSGKDWCNSPEINQPPQVKSLMPTKCLLWKEKEKSNVDSES